MPTLTALRRTADRTTSGGFAAMAAVAALSMAALLAGRENTACAQSVYGGNAPAGSSVYTRYAAQSPDPDAAASAQSPGPLLGSQRGPLLAPPTTRGGVSELLKEPEQTPYVPQVDQGVPGEGVVNLLPGQEMVVDVQVRGNKQLSTEKVLSYIRTRPNRVFDMQLIEDDVRRLNRSRLFVWVKPLSEQVPGGRRVVFEVTERAMLEDVRILGNKKIKRGVLMKELGIKVGDPVDPFAVEEGRRKLEAFYEKKGFSQVRITILEGDKTDDRRAVFVINEGNKQRVLWINFIGNTIASDGRLRTVVKSKPTMFFVIGGEVNRTQIEEDKELLTAYYRGLGFADARVGCDPAFDEGGDWLTLTFVIDEGPRSHVRDIRVVGNSKFDTATLLQDTKLHSGEFFNQQQMNADTAAMTDMYGGQGYVFAKVEPNIQFSETPGQLDIVYRITEGDRYRIGDIDVRIAGEYPHTRRTTVLNQLSFKTGDVADIRKLRESERRLRGSGLFLSDPSAGTVPKITFSPPGEDEETQVAERSGSHDSARGQSPDPQPNRAPQTWTAYRGGPQDGAVAPTSAADATPTRRLTLSVDCPPIDDGNEPANGSATAPNAPPAPTLREEPAPLAVQPPMLFRGQYTNGAPGASPSAAWDPWGSQTTTSAAGAAAALPPPSSTSIYARPSTTSAAPAAANASGSSTPSYNNSNAYPANTAYAANGNTTNSYPTNGYANNGYGNNAPAGTTSRALTPLQGTAPAAGAMAPPTPQPAPADGAYGENFYDPNAPFSGQPPSEVLRDRELPIVINTSETQTGRLMLGAGINSDAGLMGNLVFDEQNFDWTRWPSSWEEIRNATAWRGAGQRLRLEAVPGTQVQRYMATFQDPYFFNSQVSFGVSGFYYDRLYTEWDEQRLGGRISFGYHFSPYLTGSMALRAEQVNIRNPIDPTLPALAEVVGNNNLYGVAFTLAHDTRDNAFLPTEGHLAQLTYEQIFGSFQYPRAEVELRRYFLMHERPDGSGRHVLSLGAQASYSGSDTPIYDHYYAGGFTTLRGFNFRGVSPMQQGVRVGGEFMLLASIEYLFPITADDMLRGVVFCDTGTVEPTISDWNNNYRVAPGLGLRIVIPAMGPAPIALDFAFPVSNEPYDQKEVFSFWLGFLR